MRVRVIVTGLLVGAGLLVYFLVPRARPRTPFDVWASQRFVSLEGDEAYVRSLVDKMPVEFKSPLSEQQHEKLRQTLTELLIICRDGDYHRFMRYVKERQGFINPERAEAIKGIPVLQWSLDKFEPKLRALLAKEGWPPRTGMARWKGLWLRAYYEKGVWKGIALNGARITVLEQQGVGRQQVSSHIRRDLHVGILGASRSFDFPSSPTTRHTFAQVYFVAEHHSPDPSWPHYLWLRWSDAVDNWFLDTVGMAYSGDRQNNSNITF